MSTVSLETLFASLPSIDAASGHVLILQIELSQLVAQIYEKVDTGYKPVHVQKSQHYASEYNIRTAAFDDPLLEDMLLKLGLYWETYNKLELATVIDPLMPILRDFVMSLLHDYAIQYTMLVGSLCNHHDVVSTLKAVVTDDARVHWADDYVAWQLPDIEHALRQTLVTSAAIEGYYDLLVIEGGVDSLKWVRVPLLGKNRPLKREDMTLHLPVNTERCYFFIVRFSRMDDYAYSDVQKQLRPEQICYALDINAAGRRELNYNISFDPETEMIRASFENTTAQEINTKPYDILVEQDRNVQLRAAPMQVVFLVDGTLVRSQYERCRRLIAEIVQNQPDEYYWLLFHVGNNIVSTVMNTYFMGTVQFAHELENLQYDENNLYVPSDSKLNFNRAFDEVMKLDWVQQHSNYYVLLTDRQSLTDLQSNKERLVSKGIEGMGIWLASSEIVTTDDSKLQEVSVLGDWCISHLDQSQNDEQYLQARSFLLERLIPATSNMMNLDGLPLPILLGKQ